LAGVGGCVCRAPIMDCQTGRMIGDLTIREMAQRSGFSEPTLRYYEKIGLLGAVPRDRDSGYRRYDSATAERVEALACLRSSGMSVTGMRRYVDLLARPDAAEELRQLFADHADRLAAQIERLQVRHEYLSAKAGLWDARVRHDAEAEANAVTRVKEVLDRF